MSDSDSDSGSGLIAIIVIAVIGYVLYHFWLYKPIDIYEMKESTTKYDRSVTLGSAIQHYEYFSDTNWRAEKDEYDRDVVTVTALFRPSGLKPETTRRYNVVYQIKLAKNKTDQSVTTLSEEIVYSSKANQADISQYPDSDHLVLQALYKQLNLQL